MTKTYAVKYYIKDVEKYSNEVQSDDIHRDVWDIISNAVSEVNPDNVMSTSNMDFSRGLYDAVEFDENGFCTFAGDTMITATKI
jgi:hypothetical protein